MVPTKALRLQLGELLAADLTTLAPVAANKIKLINAPFVESEGLALGDLSFATFTGSAAKAGASGAQQAGIDPATQEQKITNLAPAGGWRWECTATPGSPEDIYGYALVDDGNTTLLGTHMFPTAVSIAEEGDYIDLGAVEISFVLQPMS